MLSTWINGLVILAGGFVSGTGGWATLQFILNRRNRKAEAARTEAEAEEKREAAKSKETERAQILAETQRIAQTTATGALNDALQRVTGDLEQCRKHADQALTESGRVRRIAEDLIDAVEAVYIESEMVMPSGVRTALYKARREL